MKIYILAKSKKEINEKIKNGNEVWGTEFNAFNPNGYETMHKLSDCKFGTTIAIYQKTVGGSPIAKSWGEWNNEKNQIN